MSTLNDFFVNKIVEQIKEDYMTPKYKAEVSLDTLISIFIDGVINQYLYNNQQLSEKVVSISKEFPLKKMINDQSKNIDFLYANKNVLYIVELKTTSKSYDKEQLKEYINVAKRVEKEGNAAFLLRDYETIMNKTTQSKKYKWQLDNKVKCGVMQVDKLQSINQVKILYIVPSLMLTKLCNKDSRIMCFSFQDLAQIVLTEQFVDKNTSQAWDSVKLLFNDINKMDLEL